MILNQSQLSTRDVAPGTRSFLNKSKTSFDIASLVSSEPGESPKQMSPLDSLSPDDHCPRTPKENKFRFDARWHPYLERNHPVVAENGIDSDYHEYKKYRRHQGSRNEERRESSSSGCISPKAAVKHDSVDIRSPSATTSPLRSQEKSPLYDVSNASMLPSSGLHMYLPDSQLLKAVASGSLQFPFPPLNSMKSLASLLPANQEPERLMSDCGAPVSPRVSPSHVKSMGSLGVSASTSETNYRSGLSPKTTLSQTPQTPDFAAKSGSSPTPHSPLFPSASAEMEMTRQAFFQAAANNPGFSPSNSLPGLPGPFMGSCFPRIPSNSALGASPFDSASSIAMRNAFCPPHATPSTYSPWLFRQAAAAAASARPFPPQFAGQLFSNSLSLLKKLCIK